MSLVSFAGFMIPALGAAWWLKRRGTRSFWPYVLVGGGLSWAALFLGGVHPALALVPIIPVHASRAARPGTLRPARARTPGHAEPVRARMEGAGAGHPAVVRAGERRGDRLERRERLVDRPVVTRRRASRSGSSRRRSWRCRSGLRAPGGLGYLHTLVLGVAAGIGFTVALFFATAAFPPGAILDEVKMGALLSFLAAPLAIVLGRVAGSMSASRNRSADQSLNRRRRHGRTEALRLRSVSCLPRTPSARPSTCAIHAR